MEYKTANLVITKYCSDNEDKIRFAKEMGEDKLIKRFISDNMSDWIKHSEKTDELAVGPAYIIESQGKMVGLIRLACLGSDGILNLHYGIHPLYRGQHYGTKILQEVPSIIFQKLPEVKKIELYINETNEASINCALNANFAYQSEFQIMASSNKLKVYELTRNPSN